MFPFFINNGLISQNQSGFEPGDSCVNQLFSIMHEIYKSFDDGFNIRNVFIDISKAFGKVWHEGIIFKFKTKWHNWRAFKLSVTFFKKQKTESSFKRTSFDVDQ